MANFNQNAGGLVFKPEPDPPKKKAEPKKRFMQKCDACGFEQFGRAREAIRIQNTGYCKGCGTFFGVDMIAGVTDMGHEATIKRLAEVAEAKHVILLKSGNFACEQTGDNLGVDFGDIFPVARVGSTHKPDGKNDHAMAAFTIDILVNNRPLKMLPHEFAPIHWVTIMMMKKDGSYCESYLSALDKQGYFAPSDETKEEIMNAYGDR